MAAKLRQILLHYLTRWLVWQFVPLILYEVSQKTGNFDHELRCLNGQSLKFLFDELIGIITSNWIDNFAVNI